MSFELSQLGLLLFISALVAMLTRRLRMPYTVGLVAAGMILYLFHVHLTLHLSRELIFFVALRVFLWVKTGHFLIKMGAACRSVPSSAGILHPEVHTLDAG